MLRRKSAVAIVALGIGAAVTSASAEDGSGSYAIKGVGAYTCADVIQLVENKSVDVNRAIGWVMGYITGHNKHANATFDIAAWQNESFLFSLILENCKAVPQLKLHEITDAAIEAFASSRIRERENLLNVSVNGQEAYLYESTVISIKQQLNLRVLADLPLTPEIDQPTITALVEFQRANQLPPTGAFDQRTLAALLSP